MHVTVPIHIDEVRTIVSITRGSWCPSKSSNQIFAQYTQCEYAGCVICTQLKLYLHFDTLKSCYIAHFMSVHFDGCQPLVYVNVYLIQRHKKYESKCMRYLRYVWLKAHTRKPCSLSYYSDRLFYVWKLGIFLVNRLNKKLT